MSGDLQLAIVLGVVLACAWRAFARLAPASAWRLQARLSFALEARPDQVSRRIGRWLRPSLPAAAAGCGSGCARCGGCATAPPADQSIAKA